MEPGECDIDHVLKLSTDPSKLEGTLISQPVESVKGISALTIRGYLLGRDVCDTSIDDESLEAFCAMVQSAPQESHQMVVARGTPAVHGNSTTYTLTEEIARKHDVVRTREQAIKDGTITSDTPEVEVQDPSTDNKESEPEPHSANKADDSTKSHYEQMSFVMVHRGEIVAQKTEHSDGTDGLDIYGETIAANVGKANEETLDESISVSRDGVCTAMISGVLTASKGRISISNHLTIAGDVDFETGRINFPGSVSVGGSVRDRFCVRSLGDIEIKGLVEAADIESERSITLTRGMAGKDTGVIRAEMDLTAGYLEAVIGTIRGSANVSAEITNCTLTIFNELNAQSAALRGGTVMVSKVARIGSVGSVQGVKTELLLGALPEVENQIRDSDGYMKQLERRIASEVSKKERMEGAISKATAQQVEELMEMQFEIDNLNQRLQKLTESRTGLVGLIAKHSSARLEISKAIYAKVILYLPGYRVEFSNDLIGESVIHIGKNGKPDITYQGKSGPLSDHAKVIPDDRILKISQSEQVETA